MSVRWYYRIINLKCNNRKYCGSHGSNRCHLSAFAAHCFNSTFSGPPPPPPLVSLWWVVVAIAYLEVPGQGSEMRGCRLGCSVGCPPFCILARRPQWLPLYLMLVGLVLWLQLPPEWRLSYLGLLPSLIYTCHVRTSEQLEGYGSPVLTLGCRPRVGRYPSRFGRRGKWSVVVVVHSRLWLLHCT